MGLGTLPQRRIWGRQTAVAALLVGLTAAAPATAQDDIADTTDQQFSEERMVVTASRIPVSAREVGSAISILTEEDILDRQIVITSDILRDIPGVAVNRTGPVGALTQVRIRGAEGNQTLVFIDGIEASDPFFGEFNFAHLLSTDIGRIEVLRGPQSALYGSEAIGGVISIFTREPEEGFQVDGEAQAGSFGTYQGGIGVGGGTERFGARASISYYNTDGIDISPTGNEDDGYDNLTFNFKTVNKITDDFELRATVRYTDTERDSDTQDFVFGSPTQGFVIDDDLSTEADQLYAAAEANWTLYDDALRVRAYGAFTRATNDNFDGNALTSGNRGERLKIGGQATGTREYGPAEHRLTLAVEHEELEFENINPGFPAANQEVDDQQTSIVGEYNVGLFDWIYLSGSVRHDFNELFDDATTYRFTGAAVFDETGTRFHASYGIGITDPTFFERFGFNPGTFIGNPDLEPERSRGFDIGVEQSFLSGRVVVDVTYFNADLENEIFTQFLPSFESTPQNRDGESERQGVEVVLAAEIIEDLSLQAQYTYTDATEPDGRVEVRRPEHVASANLNYRFLDGRANVNVGIDYNGEQEDNEFIFATPQDRVNLDSYVLVNVAASYKVWRDVEVFVRGENITDEDYQEVFGFASPGAAVYGGVKFQF